MLLYVKEKARARKQRTYLESRSNFSFLAMLGSLTKISYNFKSNEGVVLIGYPLIVADSRKLFKTGVATDG